jgi:hypothetical protein
LQPSISGAAEALPDSPGLQTPFCVVCFFLLFDQAFDGDSQLPGFLGARRANFQVDYLSMDAVFSFFTSKAPLAFHFVSLETASCFGFYSQVSAVEFRP